MEQSRLEQTLRLFGELAAERTGAGMLDSETKRHTDNLGLFKAMICESHEGVTLVVAGHHIMFMRTGHTLPSEIPSADALIFDHNIAQQVWHGNYKEVLTKLALEPTATRDALLHKLYYGRDPVTKELRAS